MNKKLILSIVAAAVAVGAFSFNRAGAEAPRKHDVVILWAYQGGGNDGAGYIYNGSQVYCSSSSEHAPKFTQGSIPLRTNLTELADALSLLLDQGFRISHQEPYYFVLTR